MSSIGRLPVDIVRHIALIAQNVPIDRHSLHQIDAQEAYRVLLPMSTVSSVWRELVMPILVSYLRVPGPRAEDYEFEEGVSEAILERLVEHCLPKWGKHVRAVELYLRVDLVEDEYPRLDQPLADLVRSLPSLETVVTVYETGDELAASNQWPCVMEACSALPALVNLVSIDEYVEDTADVDSSFVIVTALRDRLKSLELRSPTGLECFSPLVLQCPRLECLVVSPCGGGDWSENLAFLRLQDPTSFPLSEIGAVLRLKHLSIQDDHYQNSGLWTPALLSSRETLETFRYVGDWSDSCDDDLGLRSVEHVARNANPLVLPNLRRLELATPSDDLALRRFSAEKLEELTVSNSQGNAGAIHDQLVAGSMPLLRAVRFHSAHVSATAETPEGRSALVELCRHRGIRVDVVGSAGGPMQSGRFEDAEAESDGDGGSDDDGDDE